jgi:hypothetical protein
MIDNIYYGLAPCDLVGSYEVMCIVPYKTLMMANVS